MGIASCLPSLAQLPATAPAGPGTAIASPVFVLNSLDDSVSVINPANWTEIRRIDTGKQPHHLYLTPDETSVIVANALSDSLTFIDPKTAEVQRVVRGVLDPYQLRFSPDMKWFVTAANRLNHIDIYRWDGKEMTLAKRVATGKTPSHLWIDSKSSTIYSTMQDSDELIAIDLGSQTIKWRTKTGPMRAARRQCAARLSRPRLAPTLFAPLAINDMFWSATALPTPSAELICRRWRW